MLLASAALALGGCGGHYVARGADLYDDGRYVEAAEVFERTEERLAQSPSDERARFGLYRGATYLKLGDAVHAARWLGYARSVVTSDPGALDSSELAMLEASLKALASAKPALPEPKSESELATAPAP
jgi:tetratricopeptide (TPR) repeat protein